MAVSPFFKRVKSPASDVSSPRPLNFSQDGDKIRQPPTNIPKATPPKVNNWAEKDGNRGRNDPESAYASRPSSKSAAAAVHNLTEDG